MEYPRRSDVLKLRPIGRFVQPTRPDFSTIPRFRCGGGWKSQRFIANYDRDLCCRRNIAPQNLGATQLTVALGQQAEAQRVELDEAFGILLVVGTGIVLEGHMRFGIERVH